jgi:hypothetical protein
MINDPHNREIAGIRLTSSRFSSGGTTHTNHPVAWLGTNSVNSNFFGAAIKNNLKVLVLEIWDAIRRNQWLNDLDDEHDQWAS